MRRQRCVCALAVTATALMAGLLAFGQGSGAPGAASRAAGGWRLPFASIRLERFRFGPVAVHDHIAFDYRFPVPNDPYPHQMKQGYAFDGVEMAAALDWLWGRTPMRTTLRFSPAPTRHWAYDQDTNFTPTGTFTHGDAGYAQGRTFALGQRIAIGAIPGWGGLGLALGFLRQASRYGLVTTYDLNSNPALPSTSYTRTINERAILYELRVGLATAHDVRWGAWTLHAGFEATPMADILLRNYIPELAPTSTLAYGGAATLALGRRLGRWRWRLGGEARWESGYKPLWRFDRQTFALRLEFVSPRL